MESWKLGLASIDDGRLEICRYYEYFPSHKRLYKNRFSRDINVGSLSPVIIEPVWSIVALFLDLVQERLSLGALERTSLRKNAVLTVTLYTYQRWDLQKSDYPIKNSKQILTQSNIKL